jgi:hypothetical protein
MVKYLSNYLGFLALTCGSVAAAANDVPGSPEALLLELQQRVMQQQTLIDAQQRQIDRLVQMVEGSRATSSPSTASKPEATRDSVVNTPVTPAVTSRFDGIKLTLGGALRTTLMTTAARAQPDGSPFFLLPETQGVPQGSTKLDARPSSILLGIEGLKTGDYQAGGLLVFNMNNGDLFSPGYGLTPALAWAELRNAGERYAIGLQEDVFSPRMPKMVDSISALAGSGNPGNSTRTQLRAERSIALGDQDRLTLTVAAADSTSSNIKPQTSTENVGFPNLESRVLWSVRGTDPSAWVPGNAFELGASGVVGRFRTFSPSGSFSAFETDLWGLSVDGRWRLSRQFALQGELFTGSALGAYLGGVFQTVNSTAQKPVRGSGGWAEAIWYLQPSLHTHLGYGLDQPNSSDLFPGAFSRNETGFLNLIWDASTYVQYAVEATWRRTRYEGLPQNQGLGLMIASELRF